MIKVYNQQRQLLYQTDKHQDPVLDLSTTAFDVLSFLLPSSYEIAEEYFIEIPQGRFVVKEKNYADPGNFEIICLPDLDDLELSILANFAWTTITMQAMLDLALVDTGWTGICTSTMKRTVTGVNLTPLQAVLKAVDTFRFEVRFDTVNKVISVAEELGEDIGAYFDDELNLDVLEYQSDSYEYATRIFPVGFGGIGIESVNGGIPYLENLTYYDKIKTIYWTDERYTVLENLKYDAQKKLDKLAVPLRSYGVKLIDLSKERPELKADIFDTVWLKHRKSGTKLKQRIVQKKIPLSKPWGTEVLIANKHRELLDEDARTADRIRTSYDSVIARLELFEDSIESEVNAIKVTADEHSASLEQHQTLIAQTSQDITTAVEQVTGYTDGHVETLRQEQIATATSWEISLTEIREQQDLTDGDIQELMTYLRYSGGVLELGESGSPMTLQLTNEQMQFLESGAVVMYINGRKVYVDSLEVLSSIIIGAHLIEKYQIDGVDDTIVRKV